ncbi:hypothetical protein GIB67_038819 [Kingdonia uniflora]|uniref:Uncharacterized protein n=1 Tax=Kingdonia uniflora TaxID=39325 RepID=A0A7J7M0Y6_9MAGN|nr:hypothetical protein GIB67_038819 [Kingdonia uniflora]
MAKDYGFRRWKYSSVVRGKLNSTADSHSDTDGRTWNDNVIWVKGNYLQRDDEEPLDLRFRTVKQSVKSTVERKKSLLDEVAEEETELELVLEGLGLSRKKMVDSKSDKVTRLVKGIWLGIEEKKSKLKKAKNELEKDLAQAKTEAMKEVRQLKASHIVTIGQLHVKAKANLDEIVEERDKLGRHLMLKGYSEEEVDAIKADTYVEEGEDEEAEMVGVVDGLDGVSRQTVLDNQEDDVELPEGGSEKVVKEMSLKINDLKSGLAREKKTSKALLSAQVNLQVELDSSRAREDNVLMCNREFAEQFDRMKEANEDREDQYVKTHFRLEKLNQAVSDLTLQVEGKDYEIKKELEELSEAIERAKKLQRQVEALVVKGNQADTAQYRIQGHVQKGNTNLRECQHKLDAALIGEKVLEGEIKAKESLVKRKE